MSWKLYEEAREPHENDIAQALELGFSLFEPWENKETDAVRPVDPRPLKTGTNDVDSMMLYIQALQRDKHTDTDDPQKLLPPGGQVNGGVAPRTSSLHAKYVCKVPNCNKAFHQKRHLEIHLRSHTGERPFKCPYPGCDRSFSQQCNLKTHSRLHTGEKPFVCQTCGKSFSQKGNLTQHKLIHDTERQFLCQLDNCNKRFTQLGNLKAHHNTSHAETLRNFTQRLQGANLPEMSPAELKMFEYFKSLYKNANRGIRGRGKGTKNIRSGAESPYQLPTIPRLDIPPPGHPVPQSWMLPGANLMARPNQSQLPPQIPRQQQQTQFPPVNTMVPSQPPLKMLMQPNEETLPPFYVMERWKP